jgi:signal transduction histidine kinase
MVRDELQANGTVFDRTWALRSQQLQDSAGLLARDFGFRAAVATGDGATARSALHNLRARLGIDLAFIIGVDGRVVALDGRPIGDAAGPIYSALQAEESPNGVFVLEGTAYQAVSAPILSPVLTGWVVFAEQLDNQELAELGQLSAIKLNATVLDRRADGRWVADTTRIAGPEAAAVSRFVDAALARPSERPAELAAPSGSSIAVVKPLKSLGAGPPAVLLLRYPLAQALAPFRALIESLFLTGGLGVLVVAVGSFLLAGSLTRPITALDEAARRLKHGEDAAVRVTGADEIARLADSFNSMAAEIREREARMRQDAETLAVALDRAQAANRTTNAFLANMSHEVRTPLNGVIGLSQVLARTVKDAGQTELIGAVIRSAEALERVLSDILDAARLRGGEAEVRAEPFAIGETVCATAAVWSERAAERGLAFSSEVAPEAERVGLGDRDRIRQVLDALLSNAVKFTARGEVRIEVAATGPKVRFAVSDTGMGFDPASKERLFQPFQQADGSSTRRFGGAGLGLSIARGLAELMGGSLDGAVRPEGGSVFTLELPLPSVAETETGSEPAPARARLRA